MSRGSRMKTTLINVSRFREPLMDVLASFEEAIINDDDFILICVGAYPLGLLPNDTNYTFQDEQRMFREMFTTFYPQIHVLLENAGIKKKPDVFTIENGVLVIQTQE